MKIVKITALIAMVVTFYLFSNIFNWQEVFASIELIGYRLIFLLLITASAYWLATIGWKYCIADSEHLSTVNLFLIRHIGEIVGILNPAGLLGGEVIKVHLLSGSGIAKTTIISSLMLSRALMVLSQFVLFAAAGVLILVSGNFNLPCFPPFPWPFYLAILLISTLLSVLIRRAFLWKKAQNGRLFNLAKKRVSTWRLPEISDQLRFFFQHNTDQLYWSVLFFSLHWVVGSLEIYFILQFLGVKVGLISVLFVDMGIVLFKAAGAFVPGQVGIEEFANKIMLVAIGLPDSQIWITVSVLRRARQLFWVGFALAIYLVYFKRIRNFS